MQKRHKVARTKGSRQRTRQLFSLVLIATVFFFISITVAAAEAKASKLCAQAWQELYPRVATLLDRPLSPKSMRDLHRKWAQIDELLDQNLWQQVKTGSQRYTQINLLQVKYLEGRISPSNSGTKDLRAKEAWLRTEEKIQQWVDEKVDIDLERIFEINADLDTDNQSRLNPFVLFNPMLLLYPSMSHIPGSAGRIRTYDLHDSKTPRSLYPAVKDLPNAINDFMTWYHQNERKLHPIQLAAQAYQRLVSIHPFTNGNGRTSRLVMDWILLKNGYIPPYFPPTANQRQPRAALFGQWSEAENLQPEVIVYEMTQGIFQGIELLQNHPR